MRKFHIAQFGTYDIESLGDTMFPKMLAYGMGKQLELEVELFSMTECAEPYNGNSHVYSFEQFHERQKRWPFDAVVIGGGEFLHFKAMDVIIDGVQHAYPEGYIWKKPLELAALFGVPAYINCVGVAYDLTEKQQEVLREYFKNVRLITVRDEYSAKRLIAAGISGVVCVADNLWYMNQMYLKHDLVELRHKLEERTGRDFTTPYILVQYGTTRDAQTLACQLRAIKEENGCRICLMPVNYCHEDRLGADLLEKAGQGEFEAITDYFQPEEMMAVISGAKAFLGTSLHGNLTAASYGVPFIGIDMYASFVSKMDGIFSMIDCEQYLVPSEAGVYAAFHARMEHSGIDARIHERICEMQEKLDLHFQHVAEILEGEN